MKHLPIFILFALLVSCAREISSDKLVERDGITYEVLSTEPYSGSAYTEYEDLGRVKNGDYENGLREGPWVFFYKEGQLRWERSYREGKRVGPFEEYYENGQLKSKGSFKDGEWVSTLGSIVFD